MCSGTPYVRTPSRKTPNPPSSKILAEAFGQLSAGNTEHGVVNHVENASKFVGKRGVGRVCDVCGREWCVWEGWQDSRTTHSATAHRYLATKCTSLRSAFQPQGCGPRVPLTSSPRPKPQSPPERWCPCRTQPPMGGPAILTTEARPQRINPIGTAPLEVGFINNCHHFSLSLGGLACFMGSAWRLVQRPMCQPRWGSLRSTP